jgi:hypothetical protein
MNTGDLDCSSSSLHQEGISSSSVARHLPSYYPIPHTPCVGLKMTWQRQWTVAAKGIREEKNYRPMNRGRLKTECLTKTHDEIAKRVP